MADDLGKFTRTISDKNMELLRKTALETAHEGAWLRDALKDKELFFALRNDRVDVYYRGGAAYSIYFRDGKIIPETHVKYLVFGARYIRLTDGRFSYSPDQHMQTVYQEGTSLQQIKAAIKNYVGVEGKGVYEAIKGYPLVADVEIAFRREKNDEIDDERIEPSGHRRQDRIDVCLVQTDGGDLRLRFWEAKHFTNPELFSDDILTQLQGYEDQLVSRRMELLDAYRNVCRFNSDLAELRMSMGIDHARDSYADVWRDIADGRTPLVLDEKPSLLVFGFDNDQKNGRWAQREADLKRDLGPGRLRSIGVAKDAFKAEAVKLGRK